MRHPRPTLLPGMIASVAVIGLLAGCGGDDGASPATTLAPLGPTNFATIPPVAETTTTSVDNPLPAEQMYEVQAGDYLSSIANAWGVSMQEIAAYNEWDDGINHPLFPGDQIKIPAGGTPPTTAAGGGTTTVAVSGGLVTTTTPGAAEGATYTVEAGDYLAGIASKFDTTVDAIVQVNGWSDGANHAIYPGDVIKLPA